MNVYLFDISLFIYLFAFALYLIFVTTRGEKVGRAAFSLLFVGFVIHFVGMIVRWRESHLLGYGYIPLSNMYESLVFFSWCIVLFYIIMDKKYNQRIIGVIASPLASLFLALPSLVGLKKEIKPLIPALQSNWLAIHVITCFLGYGAFAIAFGISIAYLLQSKREGEGREGISWLPSARLLDEINYKTILFGFPFLTLGIITGAAWAHYAWGSYWSWDPKETWSLITWFIYAAFLHARYTREWRGRKAALLSIIGFLAVIFTYFGVNFIISGLHSYV